ncbi:unnamed protein product [Cochlearia groenlandica]
MLSPPNPKRPAAVPFPSPRRSRPRNVPGTETLKLRYWRGLLERLDMSKSTSVRRLDVDRKFHDCGPSEIITPHVRYLRLVVSLAELSGVLFPVLKVQTLTVKT